MNPLLTKSQTKQQMKRNPLIATKAFSCLLIFSIQQYTQSHYTFTNGPKQIDLIRTYPMFVYRNRIHLNWNQNSSNSQWPRILSFALSFWNIQQHFYMITVIWVFLPTIYCMYIFFANRVGRYNGEIRFPNYLLPSFVDTIFTNPD